MTRLRLAAGDTFRSLRHRNFRLFFTGQLVSQVGNWLTLIAQTLLVLHLTHSGVALGGLVAAQFGPVLLLGAFAGLVADRSDKRRLMLTTQSLAMVQSFCLAALAFSGNPPVAAIYAVAFAGGCILAFDNPTRRSFVVELVPEDEISNAVSLNSALMTGARVVGPAIAGLLVTTVGFGWCFLLDGLSYTAVLAALWMMDPTGLRPSEPAARGRGQVREGLRYVRSVTDLFVPLVMMAVIGVLAFNFQVVLPLFSTRDLGGSDLTFTLLMSVVSLGSLLGALGAARRRIVTLRIVSLGALAFGASMALLAVVHGLPAAFAVGFLVGISSVSFMTTSTAIVQVRAKPSMRGRVLALQAIVFLGSTPLGGPIVGAVSQHLGARWGIALGAAGALAAGAGGLVVAGRNSAGEAAELPEPGPDDPLLAPRAS
ncbi:MAG TPA: MFS transporter [Acidimicrobiales bacterium]|nr:MFS transporter [Acidimicrobiales bacterium]